MDFTLSKQKHRVRRSFLRTSESIIRKSEDFKNTIKEKYRHSTSNLNSFTNHNSDSCQNTPINSKNDKHSNSPQTPQNLMHSKNMHISTEHSHEDQTQNHTQNLTQKPTQNPNNSPPNNSQNTINRKKSVTNLNLDCYQVKDENTAKCLTNTTHVAVKNLQDYCDYSRGEVSFIDRIFRKRAQSFRRRATSLIRRQSSQVDQHDCGKSVENMNVDHFENSGKNLGQNLNKHESYASLSDRTPRHKSGQNIEQRIGEQLLTCTQDLMNAEKKLSHNASAVGIFADGMACLGGLRQDYRGFYVLEG